MASKTKRAPADVAEIERLQAKVRLLQAALTLACREIASRDRVPVGQVEDRLRAEAMRQIGRS